MGRPRETSDEDILERARVLFSERGHIVPTREIARAAGISQAVLYQRYPSKSALFFAAMAPAEPDVDAILGERVLPIDKYLEGVVLRALSYFEDALPAVVQLMAHPEFDAKVMGRLHERILAGRLVEALAERLRELRRDGLVGDVDGLNAARTLVAALHSVAVFHVMSGANSSKQARQLAPRVVSVLWNGLAPR